MDGNITGGGGGIPFMNTRTCKITKKAVKNILRQLIVELQGGKNRQFDRQSVRYASTTHKKLLNMELFWKTEISKLYLCSCWGETFLLAAGRCSEKWTSLR